MMFHCYFWLLVVAHLRLASCGGMRPRSTIRLGCFVAFAPSDRRTANPATEAFSRRRPFLSRSAIRLNVALQQGETILVVGGTGGVGQLVSKKLRASDFQVRVTSRDKARGEAIMADESIDVRAIDLVGDLETDLRTAMQDVSGVVISVGTTAFPTTKWAGGNTPQAIDDNAVTRIARVASTIPSIKKVILLTSVGVYRTKEMPFLILNLCGVLDAKRNGEDAVKAAATQGSGYEYAIVRPDRLVGGPYTNEDFVKLLQIQGGAENGVDVARGDSLLGDCKRDACAESVVQCLMTDCANIDFSIVSNNDKPSLTSSEWTSLFKSL
jgi:NAD(P)H-binding